jgi:hypothetical protein
MRKGHRQYSEHEMAAILERAAALQGTSAMVPVHGGRTLDEIRAIAGEAGLDAACVEAAVRSLDQVHVPSGVLGRSPRMELETTIAGQLDEEDRRELLGVLQRSFDARGRAVETARTLEWRRMGILGRELVVIHAHKGRTRIEVRGRYRRGMAASYAAGGAAGALASAGLLDLVGILDAFEGGAVALVLAGAFFAGRTVWGWLSRSKERHLRRVADKLSERAEESVGDGE